MELPEAPRHGTKMKMRNLRAKVKLLLPNNICRHYKDRNAKMEKFQPKRQKSMKSIRQSTLKDHWCQGTKQMDPWYYQTTQPLHMFAQFHKLTPQQLQQISDNKHYFLPEKYVQPFTQYILQQNNSQFKSKQLQTAPCDKETIKKRKYYHKSNDSASKIPIIPNLIRTTQYIQRHLQKQKQVKERYQILQQIRKNKTFQKQGFIEAKIMKAMNTKYEIGQIKYQTNRKNVQERVKNVKNSQQLKMIRSQRTDIIRMTSELKRICTFRRKEKSKQYFVDEDF